METKHEPTPLPPQAEVEEKVIVVPKWMDYDQEAIDEANEVGLRMVLRRKGKQ